MNQITFLFFIFKKGYNLIDDDNIKKKGNKIRILLILFLSFMLVYFFISYTILIRMFLN